MVLSRKPNFFGLSPHSFPKDGRFGFLVSLGKHWFSFPKPSVSWEKDAKTIFFLGKTKNNLFGVWPHGVSKGGFLVFPGKVRF